MTNQPTPDRSTRREPVPIGLFLAPVRRDRSTAFARPDVPDWHGLSPRNVARLIAHYTRFGDVVLDLDAHPTIAAAARYLRRAPARLVTHGGDARVRLTAPPPGQDRPRRVVCRPGPGANLIVVTLPRAEADAFELHATTRAMGTWRRLLRPGGHLIAALTPGLPGPGGLSPRATVIAAARAAGLLYHQHIPVLLVPLPEHDPRTAPDPGCEPAHGLLHDGRHAAAFTDLVVFAGTTTAEEADRA